MRDKLKAIFKSPSDIISKHVGVIMQKWSTGKAVNYFTKALS